MTTYYVSNTGLDSNDGSIISPWSSMQHAITQVSNTDTIYIVNSITTTTTIIINKEITITNGSITKTTAGDLFLIRASNVTINTVTLTSTATNTADCLINIDRGSIGLTLPTNYSNCIITGCTLNMYKYGIILNGSSHTITSNNFLRSAGTERLTCIIIYYINNATITSNIVTDTLRMQRFIYLTMSGSGIYINEVNTKTGLITCSGNVTNCSSAVQGLQFIIQDSFIGSLSFSVHDNTLNNSVVATKLFISYISSGSDLSTISNVTVYNNYQSLTASGAVVIDAPASVTVDPNVQIFNTYDNTGNFTLRIDYTGNINFTQSSTIGPADLYLSPIVVYSGSGGGDPHIMSIYGIKTTLPNNWSSFVLYKGNITIIAKAEYIVPWLKNNQLHYFDNGSIKEIEMYKHSWVTNYTYITEISVIKNDKKLVFDTITGFVKYDNSTIIYNKSDVPVLSLTHNIKYPPKNLISFEIDLEPDLLVISVDNYWDDINSIRLFPRESIGDKTGELIKHSSTNCL